MVTYGGTSMRFGHSSHLMPVKRPESCLFAFAPLHLR